MSLAKQPPFFDNELITISSTVSSPKSGLATPSVPLAVDNESTILLYVDEVNLDSLRILGNNLDGLLPVRSASRVMSLSQVH